MIESCIVAKLVMGYLTDEGFHRTCSAFQEECSLFHNGNSELEQVVLTADLKTILEDYSQLKETGRENGIPSSTAVLKSLWKDLDIVIGQLKYATMPNAPKVSNVGSQSTRTRRLNSGRVRRSTLQKNHENTTRTMTNSSPVQRSSTLSLGEGNATEELLLPRLSPVGPRQNLSSPDNNQATNSQSCADGRMLNGVRSNANKDLNVCQTSCSSQSTGVPVAVSIPHMPCTGSGSVGQVTGTPSSCVPPSASSANSHTNNEQLGNACTAEGMLDVMDDGDACSDGDFIHNGAIETTPVIVINDENSKDQRVTTIEEHSNPSQNELQLRSPKRKGVQPKKRVPQAEPGTSAASDSPVKLVSQPANQEVEMDIMCAPDTLTPQSFLDTLLSTPLLQEKLAENINKVVSSSRAQPVNDELPLDSTQSVTTSEASSNDVLMASNQEAGDDIPVKEIMDLMQADPAFDVLFSFFGLDALDALPLETNSRTVLDGASADSNQVDRSSSPPSTSETNIQVDTLGALSSLATEIVPDLGNAVTTLPGSNQQLDTPSSSSASDLHLSATTIVTDALLLLAGSPQKKIQETGQLSYSTGQHNLITPPKRVHSVPRSSANDSLPGDQSVSNQPALITSTLPYVRALNFTQGQGSLPGRRGRKKGSKNKNTSKKNVTTNEQNKAPSNKKGANGGRKRSVAKKPPELTSVSSSQAMSFSSNSTDISGQPFTNCGSAFNRTIVHHPSPMNVMMPTYCPNPPPHSFGNCVPVPTPLPANVIIPSANCTPSGVACITPVTGLNTVVSPSPVSYTGTLASHFPLPATHSTLGTSPAPSPVNLSTCPTHSPVNFTTSVSVHVPSPFPSGHLPVCSPPVSLAAVYSSLPPAAGHFVNQGMCPTPSSVSVVNAGPVHSPVPPSTEQLNVPVIPSTASMQQVVNTITSINSTALTLPGHFTESTAVSATARTGNSLTAQENCDVGVAIGFRPSASSETVDIGAGGSSTPMEPLALRATNLLQTLAAKHVNTEANSASPQNLPAGPNIGQLSAHSLQNNMLLSTVDELVRHQPLKEKSVSRGNINISQDNTKALNEKQMESIPLGQELRGALPIEVRSLNSQESNSGSTSLLETLSQECSELRKENSAGFLHSKNNKEREIQGSSILERKRQRNAIEPQKKKKTKSSRPSKRSKTEGQRMNFPSDLNVEEFLSTLHYEDK